MFSGFFNFEKDPFFDDHKERMKEMGLGQPILGESFTYPSLWGLEPPAPNNQNSRSNALRPADGSDTRGPVNARDRALDREGKHMDRFDRDERVPYQRGGDPFNDMFNRMNSMMSRFMDGSGLFGRRGESNPTQNVPDFSLLPNPSRDNPNSFMGSFSDPRGDSHGYFQSSVYSYRSNGEGHEPEVYEAHHSKMTAPGGLKEERKALRDSKRDLEKMSVGRHINERGHTVEKQRNTRTDDLQQHETLDELKKEDVNAFHGEWREKTSRFGRLFRGEGKRELEAGQRESRDIKEKLPAISHL